jgi:hypothetical protein
MADTNEELEICHSLENVNCNNETPNESTEPKPTHDEPIVPDKPEEPITTNESIVTTEPSTSMD